MQERARDELEPLINEQNEPTTAVDDDSNHMRNVLESRTTQDEELNSARNQLEEADMKHELAIKLQKIKCKLESAEERTEGGELKVDVSEEKANQRVPSHKLQTEVIM